MKANRNFKIMYTLLVSVIALALSAMPALAEKPAHEFVGVKKCKNCHKKEKIGKQFPLWEKSKHAGAFATLATEKGKEFASKAGVEDPQASGKCLSCHATAYYFTEEKVSEKVTLEEGVSCESCHGPGKDYKSMKVMKDHEASVAKGLLDPGEKTCVKCHNDTGPHPQAAFDYKERVEKIKHSVPGK